MTAGSYHLLLIIQFDKFPDVPRNLVSNTTLSSAVRDVVAALQWYILLKYAGGDVIEVLK